IGQRRAVSGAERTGRARVEGVAQRGELLERGIAPHVVIGFYSRKFNYQIVEEAGLPRGGRVLMAGERELVLLAAAHLPLLRHLLAMLAHRHAGARLGDAGMRRLEVGKAYRADGRELFSERATPRQLQHRLLQLRAVAERDVA